MAVRGARMSGHILRRSRRRALRLVAIAAVLAGTSVVSMPVASGATVLSGTLGSTLTRPDLTTPQGLGGSGMSGLQHADPAAGVDLVQPPTANSQGDAEVSLPLSVPAGRAGVQPDLTLSYSSYNSEGWVGLGWSLDPGSVGIDTRYGAPRYLSDKESETYTLDGDELSPTAVRSTLLDRQVDRADWTRRVESSYERIVRHGSAPGNYSWEVTDQNGTTRLYGARSHFDTATGSYVASRDAASILSDDSGHDFRWGLSQVRDISGNTVDYTYTEATGHDVGADRVSAGRELYLNDIKYTGSVANGNADDPAYEVRLVRDSDLQETPRRDVVINAKGGFLEVTADLLRHVDVYHRGDLVRRFSLAYTTGAFGKTLLATVGEAGSNGVVWQSHAFDYYDDVRDGSGTYHGFGAAQDWNTGSDNVHENLLTPQSISALGGSLSQGGDGRAYLGFNPSDPLKDGSFGGALVIKGGATEGKAEMVDLNGDNLPDKVFVDGSGLSYRLNVSHADGSAATFGSKRSVVDLGKLSHETYVEAAGGPEVYAGLTVQFNVSAHFDIGDSYFSDVNFDGLPDFVDGGTVYFNHLDNGTPTFSTSSQGTAVPIDNGTSSLPNLPQLQQAEADQNAKSPPVDTVRRWVAPWTGTLAVAGAVTLAPASGTSSTDGVRVAVQHGTDELWHATLAASGQTATPSGVGNISVNKGEALYFRVGSVNDGVQDRVTWSPTVSYTDVSGPTDANALSQTAFSAADDFTTAGRPGTKVIMPLDGHVSVSATVHKTAATSDDVTVRVFHNGTAVIDHVIAGSFVGDVPVSADFDVSAPASGSQDSVEARLVADSPVDVTALSWTPDLHYTSATDAHGASVPTTDPTTGQPSLALTVPTDTDIYPSTDLSAPQTAWTSTLGRDVSVTPHVTFAPVHKAGQVTLTVKTANDLLAKKTYDVPANGALPGGALSATLANGTAYWFDLTVRGADLPSAVGGSSVTVDYNDGTDHSVTVPSARHWADAKGVFPVSYRGWGYAGYNGQGKEDQPLDPDAFVFHQADFPTSAPTGFNDPNYKDPTQGRSYVYTPYVLRAGTAQAEPVWRGVKDSLYGGAADAQSSRLVNDSIDLVGPLGGGQRAVPRLSMSIGLNLVAGVGPLSGAFGWGPSLGLLDYTDLNGDGFPDVVGPGFVRYTGPRGGYVSTGDGSGHLDVVGNDTTIAGGGGFDGSALEIKANSKADANTSQAAPGAITKSSRRSPSGGSAQAGETADDKETGGKVGFSLGVSTSTSNEPASGQASFDLPQEQELSDVNGDGLPDRVRVKDDTVYVRFNTGYGFSSDEVVWASNARFENGQSISATAGPTLGFNISDMEFAGGLSLSESYDAMKTTWTDVDGDGVLDKLTRSGGKIEVSFGTGSGLLPPVVFGDAASLSTDNPLLGATDLLQGQQVASGHDVGLGAGVDFTIGIGPLCIAACYLIVNPGGHFDRSVSSQQVEMTDVNGDGLPDSVSSSSDSGMSVRENLTRRTNLLKAVHNPLGGTISLDYTRKGNTVNEPYSQWAMSRVDVNDGRPGDGVNNQVSTYTYDGNSYNALERVFLGYHTVTQNQIDVTHADQVLRTYVRTYDNDNVFDSGLQTAETLVDPATGNPVTRTLTEWRLVDLATKTDADLAPTAADPANVRLLTMAVSPRRVRTTQQWFDSTGTLAKSTATQFTYDDLGAVVQTRDFGEPGTTADDVTADVTYSQCTGAGDSWVHLPATLRVTDAGGHLLRERDGSADLCANGAITHLVETTGDGPPAVTDLAFDAWGDYNHVEYPANA
ncbi:MAG TPA: SpvB/TcaC N-terminal domain-containing protein, partial [Actinopolymorphaceae bacterium]|nr:SpvB/TcaC N-terminal domain-containing protein [Actinopolymorphaceae bacterium]